MAQGVKLVEFEDKFDRDGNMAQATSESNFNTLEEAMTQAKHDMATGQRQIMAIRDEATGTQYSPKQIKDYKLKEEKT